MSHSVKQSRDLKFRKYYEQFKFIRSDIQQLTVSRLVAAVILLFDSLGASSAGPQWFSVPVARRTSEHKDELQCLSHSFFHAC